MIKIYFQGLTSIIKKRYFDGPYKIGSYVIILFFFTLLSLIFTYPLIFNFSSSFYGLPGDPSGTIWRGWWLRYSDNNLLDSSKTAFLSAPFGTDFSSIPFQALPEYVYIYLYSIVNEITFWNFFLFLSFPLSAITMFLLVHYVTRNTTSSVIAGIIYAFCPYHFYQAYQHIWLSTIQWIPLYLLFLIKVFNDDFTKWNNFKNSILCAFAYFLVLSENYYYGYFVFIFTVVFLIIHYLYFCFRLKSVVIKKKIITTIILTACLSFLFILPLTFHLFDAYLFAPLKTFLYHRETNPANIKILRDYGELFIYSARIHDYFIPPVDNPFWGKYFSNFIRHRLHGSNLFENTLFLGYLPLILSFIGIIFSVTNKDANINTTKIKQRDLKKWSVIFGLTGFVMMIFSAPPNPTIFGIKLYMPSYFLYKFLSMFRVYARFGLLVMLCVSVLSGIGLVFILQKLHSQRKKISLSAIVIIFIFLEFINFPPYKITQATQTPEVYHWLKKQKGDLIIAEYPMVNENEVRQYIYQFYQREHEKKTVNGARLNTIGEDFRNRVYDLNDLETAGILAYLKTKYVFVHKDIYKEGRLPKVLQKYYDPNYIAVYPIEYNSGNVPNLSNRVGFQAVKDFGDTIVYEVTAKPQQFINLYGDNIGNPENWGDNHIWRWMKNNGKIKIVNTSEEDAYVSIEFDAVSFSRDRQLNIYINEHDVKNLQVVKPKEKYIVNNVKLKPGDNNIVLDCPDGTDNIDKILHNGDVRDVSIAFTHFRIIENDKNREY